MSDSMNEITRLIEALLFASAEPLSTKALHERMSLAGYEGADVGTALLSLQKDYDGRGVNLIQFDGQWAFRSAADLSEAMTLEREESKKLSRAAMETLAIIAYHQPVTRAEVENIRGVSTHRGTLDVLIEAGWVKPGRRRETPGRPLTWVTTPGFLDHFSIESLMDLPGMDDLKASGLLDRRPAIEAIPGSDDTGDLFSGQDRAEDLASNDDEEAEDEHAIRMEISEALEGIQ